MFLFKWVLVKAWSWCALTAMKLRDFVNGKRVLEKEEEIHYPLEAAMNPLSKKNGC